MSSLLEVVGIAAVAVGLGMWTLWVGVVAGGVGMLALGVLLDPPRAVRRRS
jgi:hypothetical protein